MKKLIVYYSLEGNTEYIAQLLAERTAADIVKLVPVKAYSSKGFSKFFWGGKSALMEEQPKLEPYSIDWSAYDEVVIGFPVWAGTITPPIRTFVCDNAEVLKEKKITAFACQAGSGAEKAFEKLKDLIGAKEFTAKAVFTDPKKKPSESTAIIFEELVK